MGIKTNDVYAGNFLKADSLKGDGGNYNTMRLTIHGARMHKFDDGTEQIVIGFKEDGRELGLNKTNAAAIEEITGSNDTDDWEGKRVEIYVDKNVMYAGKKIPAIRVRALDSAPASSAPFPATIATKATLAREFAKWSGLDAKDPEFVPKLTKFAGTEGVSMSHVLEDQAAKLITVIAGHYTAKTTLNSILSAADDLPF